MEENKIKKIQKNYQAAFLEIPSAMPLIIDKSECQKIFKNSKDKENEDITNSEADEPYLSEESFIGYMSSDNEKIFSKDIIKSKISKTKISIDINSGKTIESLFISRVDRDIFGLKYHMSLEKNKTFDFSEYNEISLEKEYNSFLKYFELQSKYLIRFKEIFDFLKELKIEMKGEFDFLINDVLSEDIISIIKNEENQNFIFADENLFKEKQYTILGEITINLFKPTNYERKLKQLLKYIIIIKLLNEHSDYFQERGIKKKNRAIMLVTNGNYIDIIQSIEKSKIFSKDYQCEDMYDSSSIEKIIKRDKFDKNIKDFNNELSSIGGVLSELKNQCVSFLDESEDFEEYKKNVDKYTSYNMYKKQYNSLKEKTFTILKVLKNSNIPFMIIYFPKIGNEMPYNLFKDYYFFIKKEVTSNSRTKYKYEAIKKDSINDFKINEFKKLLNNLQSKMDQMNEQHKKDLEQMNNQHKKDLEQMEEQMNNKHKKDLEQMNNQHKKDLEQMKEQMNKQIKYLQNENQKQKNEINNLKYKLNENNEN